MIRPDTLVFRTLAAMARQRPEFSPAQCGAVAELFHASSLVHQALQRRLEQAGLTDLKFAILVALYALDPTPVSPADLAFYTGFTRSSVHGAVTGLERTRLLVTQRDPLHPRTLYCRLTLTGRRIGESSALAYLRAVSSVAGALRPPALDSLQRSCTQLVDAAARLATASPQSASP